MPCFQGTFQKSMISEMCLTFQVSLSSSQGAWIEAGATLGKGTTCWWREEWHGAFIPGVNRGGSYSGERHDVLVTRRVAWCFSSLACSWERVYSSLSAAEETAAQWGLFCSSCWPFAQGRRTGTKTLGIKPPWLSFGFSPCRRSKSSTKDRGSSYHQTVRESRIYKARSSDEKMYS